MRIFTTFQRLFVCHKVTRSALLLVGFLFAAIQPLLADPITREQAQQRAADFLQDCKGSRRLAPVTEQRRLAKRKTLNPDSPLYYVFDRGTDEGFVIISGEDKTDAVLGYTDSGTFDYQTIPDNMRAWLDDMEDQIAKVRAGGAVLTSSAVPLHPAIPAMITTRWNQGDPYNLTCPNYHGLGRSVTGCVATAMAQLLYYQRAKSVTETQAEMPAYDTYDEHPTYGHLHVEGIPAGSPIDWDNMRDTYSGGESQKAKMAVADLMHYCGVSVFMEYSNSSSGAYSFNVPAAFQNYFGYGESVQYFGRWGYSNAEWDAIIYNELMNDRPLYMSGANSSGGHAFVCDGYDGKRNFHINWGWGGSSDGFYLLSKLTPGSQGIGGTNDGYNSQQAIVIGLEPINFQEKEIIFEDTYVKRLCITNWDADGDGRLTFAEAARVTDLGRAFAGSRIKTFNELRNFTGLTAIPDSAFAGCSSLTNISLPEHIETIGAAAFRGAKVLKNLLLPTGVKRVGEGAFADCRALTSLSLTEGVTAIAAETFRGCVAFTSFDLPAAVTSIGDRAFAECTKLKTFNTATTNPETWEVGDSIFEGVDLSAATLNVLQGTRDFFVATAPWNRFGNLYVSRIQPDDVFIPLNTERVVCLYNVGTKAYLQKGEAYETQAVVGGEPLRYYVKPVPSKEGLYYLTTAEPGYSHQVLFRTMQDGQVGEGVKACFVDGTLQTNAYWQLAQVDENTYTLQVPRGQSGYKEGQFLGIDPEHRSDAFNPTMGLYFDIDYAGHEANCQWRFVDYELTYGIFRAAEELKDLLTIAKNKRVNAQREQAVLDDMNSTYEQLMQAQRTLRGKLKLVHFEDETVKSIMLGNWDVDGDGEINMTEAALVTEVSGFYHKDIVTFDELPIFQGVTVLYGNSFEGCTSLESIKLPAGLTTMYYRVFYGCSSLTSIFMNRYVTYIGENNFDGCTALKTVSIAVEDPSTIYLGPDVFKGVDLKNATLIVPKGSREAYAAAPVWKEFGTIKEMRARTKPAFSEITPDAKVYVYNIGSGKYINKGEAYGTQAVVSANGLLYLAKRQGKPENNTYYLYSDQTGSSNKVLFRTSTDTKVGEGVKACFVDGGASSKAYWKVQPVEGKEHVYTFQVPETDGTYVEGEYLGVQTSHHSDYERPTFGLYWDVSYKDYPEGCQWAFVTWEDMLAAEAIDEAVLELETLLDNATKKGLDVTAEQAVYDDLDSTPEQVQQAIGSLRGKMQLIDFADAKVKQLCTDVWDADADYEISRQEVAEVTDIAHIFRSQTSIKSFEELRYFTSLTAIPSDAFRNCTALTSIYLPAQVKSVGDNAFNNATGLKYMAVLSDAPVTGLKEAALPKNVQVFVPAALVETYAADEGLAKCTVQEYTGTPTVTSQDQERIYGRANSKFTFEVTGAPINGDPALTCEADVTAPVGSYDIVVAPGTITSPGLQCVNGLLTVNPSPLTVTAKSYTRYEGEPNPEFECTYGSFKNREKAADVILVPPTMECDATPESPAGEYEIRIFGAEALNYEFNYVPGVLTVLPDKSAVRDLSTLNSKPSTLHDLSGRRVGKQNLKRGIYIIDGQKRVK
ncbi:MAG: C10 family peptidase [Bacteroidaceae bacterium]|nr:C10 family peptidase [Bacteroidaceae bacterium]